jgi:hypothetical protein
MPRALYPAVNSSSTRYASAHHRSGSPVETAAFKILSSMSVTFRTSVTS